ncbi:MAG: ComEA family DNA-binding protein, partial [bacterium]
RKGVYRVATTETWLERTAVKEKGVIFSENLTAVWLKFAEKLGSLSPVPDPKLYSAPPGLVPKPAAVGLININSAPEEVLCELPGIGPKTAQRIIEYRERVGKFKSVEELMNVRGIGPKKFEKIKDLITVR